MVSALATSLKVFQTSLSISTRAATSGRAREKDVERRRMLVAGKARFHEPV